MSHRTRVTALASFAAGLLLLVANRGLAQPSHASYQGQLLVSGAPFTGSAQFKFAIVSGPTNVWANDGTASGTPAAAVTLAVNAGIFSVRLGDTSIAGMTTALGASALQLTSAVLRVWVSTGGGPFTQLADTPLSSSPFALQSDAAKRALNGFSLTGDLQVLNASAKVTAILDAAEGTTGSLLRLYDIDSGGNPRASIELDSREGASGAALRLYNGVEGGANPNQATVEIQASEADNAPAIYLFDDTGQLAIELNAKGSDGSSRIVTDVVQIRGGMDLSERFHVAAAEDGAVGPGAVVSIDPASPGNLEISRRPYDRRVAGVVSGAGGVNTGMILGQEGSPLSGAHPVALSGRVYCLADAGFGAIEPGDLLTTSATPGHAMRVKDPARAQGAILGKAMTTLGSGRGLVLVLVGLQ